MIFVEMDHTLITVGNSHKIMVTPNSPVSRNAQIRVQSSALADILSRVTLDKPSGAIRILFKKSGSVSIWTHDIAKTVQMLVTDLEIPDIKVKEDCVLLIEPDSFANLLLSKYVDQNVQITTSANNAIVIKDQQGSEVVFHPADESDCQIVPDRWIMPKDSDGWIQIPQKDNETCTSRITISRNDLAKGVIDMKVANAPYVVFSFGSKKSSCRSGHWGVKSNQSQTQITANVEGDDIDVVFTDNLSGILSKAIGDAFTIQKHSEVPFVIMECGAIRFVASEAQKEV